MHVLGMPPAFVLSQDQTLKFIPDLLPLETNHPTNPSEVDPNKGLQTFASMHEHQATPSITLVRPPSAHPFPLLHNLNQQSRGQTQTGPATEGPRLYAHPTPLVNSRFECRWGDPGVRRTANVMPPTCRVQSGVDKKFTNMPQIRPSSRNSASNRSEGGSPASEQSPGASSGDR